MTPVTVTEVKSGTVALVSGTAVYVRTPEGVRLFTQSELDKRGVKIFVDGKPRAVSELHEGNRLTATIVTTKPPSIVTEKEVQATLAKTGGAPAASAAPAPAPSAAQAGTPVSPAQQPVATTARTLPSTAGSGTCGNSGIAGHRDGFFRGLKDVGLGDAIELETLQERQLYRIERIWIVDPEEVSVLDSTHAQSITLVTCYPFYFVGSAPQRYIVRAVRAEPRHVPILELVSTGRPR